MIPGDAGMPKLSVDSLGVIVNLGKKALKILEYFNPFEDFPTDTELLP